jgi:hypothetical protein
MKPWIAAVLLAWLTAALPGARAEDARDAPPSFEQRAEQLLWWGDLEGLQRLYDEATRNRSPDPATGHTARAQVTRGIAKLFNYEGLDARYVRELDLLTERWSRERPTAALPQLLHLRVVRARAWHVRGGGYWSSVPDSARAEYERQINRAVGLAKRLGPAALEEPAAAVYLLMVGRDAGWPKPLLQGIADQGAARAPGEEWDIYNELAVSLLPKWGGDWGAYADLAEAVDTRTHARRGHELYAELWVFAVNEVQGNLFEETRARWPRLREGLERLASQRQGPSYRNRLGYFACLAKDRETARTMLSQLGDTPALEHWRGGGASGRTNFEACQSWLGAQR